MLVSDLLKLKDSKDKTNSVIIYDKLSKQYFTKHFDHLLNKELISFKIEKEYLPNVEEPNINLVITTSDTLDINLSKNLDLNLIANMLSKYDVYLSVKDYDGQILSSYFDDGSFELVDMRDFTPQDYDDKFVKSELIDILNKYQDKMQHDYHTQITIFAQ